MLVNENYTEDLVKVESNSKSVMMRVGIIAAAILVSAMAFLFIPQFFMLILVLVIGLAYFGLQYTKIEYEYLFLSPDFDVDKIINRNRRKRVFSTSFQEIQIVAPYGSHHLERYLSGKISKTLDYSSGNPQHKKYSMIISQENAMIHVIIEPSEETIQLFRMTSIRKVFLD